jgi:hypothetical protein
MEGIRKIVYLAEKEAFELSYIPGVISLREVFEGIEDLGKERNPPYKCHVIPNNEIREEG